MVYPIIDILIPPKDETNLKIDGGTSKRLELTKGFKQVMSDDVVGAFDWSLQFRWESAENNNRVKISTLSTGKTPQFIEIPGGRTDPSPVEVMSPATPGVFVVSAQYFYELGGFDDVLQSTSLFGPENVELSLRLLCIS